MKNINKLSPEEQKELISYTSTEGTTIYYSNISVISDDFIIHDGEEVKLNESVLNKIKLGKDKYELYKLSLSASDAEIHLQTNVDRSVSDYLKLKLADISTVFNVKLDELHDTIQSRILQASKASTDTNTLNRKLNLFSDAFDKFESELNLDSLISEISSSVRTIKPVARDINEALTTLRSMFK